MQHIRLEVREDGVAVATFDRPPINAVSLAVYEDLGALAATVDASAIRCVVIDAPTGSRAWCGGADLNDFVDIGPEGRRDRYAVINAQLRRFADLDRPVIAAINGHAIGIGMILAGLCDLRVAASDAQFACPEINYGLVGGGAGLFAALGVPQGTIREMLFTGRRFSAEEMARAGFLNAVVPRAEVVEAALALAQTIAGKSLPAIRARKSCSQAIAGLDWFSAYLVSQEHSAGLAAGKDGKEGVRAFLEGRRARYDDA